jgi:hypothetical protein
MLHFFRAGIGEGASLSSMLLPARPGTDDSTRAQITLLLFTTLMVLARSIDFVLYIRMSFAMRHYEYFLVSLSHTIDG